MDSRVSVTKSDFTKNTPDPILVNGHFTCPSPYIYNADTFSCDDPLSNVEYCIYPMAWNPQTGQCEYPYQNTGGSGGSGGNEGGSTTVVQGQTSVTVNNAINISEQGIAAVAEAVKQGITDGSTQAAEIAKNSSNAIIDGVKNVADAIKDSTTSFLDALWNKIKDIGSFVADNLKSLVSFITDNLGAAIKDIAGAVKSALGPIVDTITAISQQIQKINDTLIQPIATAITTTISTISTLTIAIERDLKDGLSGILQIPTDIANSLTSLDASLNRTVQQLGEYNKEVVSVTLGGTKDDTIHTRLKDIGTLLGAMQSKPVSGVNLQDAVRLSDPGINKAIGKSFDAISTEVLTFVTTAFSSFGGIKDAMKALPLAIPLVAEAEWELPAALLAFVLVTIEAYKPALAYIEEDIQSKTGLTKLDPATALAAWQRSFINDESLKEELGVRGYDAGRQQVIRDLQSYLIDTGSAFDMWFRGIIDDVELDKNLKAHGIFPNEAVAIKEAAYKLFDPQTAIRAWRYNIISEDELKTILQFNRFTPAEADIVIATALQPETMSNLLTRYSRSILYSSGLTQDAIYKDAPAEFLEAGKRDGLTTEATIDAWLASFNVPALQQWISLYHRGVRTRTELEAVFDYYRVPHEWRDDYLQSNKSLIPFRTIPAMVKAGIIGEAYAKQQLQAHGFDLQATEALLAYAMRSSTPATATKAVQLHDESVGVATELHQLGAINDSQFSAVLLAHNYTQSAIDAQLQLSSLKLQLQHRKDSAAEIVAHAISGGISYEQAQNALEQGGFSTAEVSRYLKQIRNAQKLQSKMPSESELEKMVKAKIIDETRYKNVLQQIGFSSEWAENFATLRFAHATPTT